MLLTYFWSLVGFLAFFRNLIPPDVYRFLGDLQRTILKRCSLYHTVTISDAAGVGSNDLFTFARLYSTTLIKNKADAITAECPQNARKLSFAISPSEHVVDEFRGAAIKWEFQKFVQQRGYDGEFQHFELCLTFAKSDRDLVPFYLEFVMEQGKEIQRTSCEKRLYTNFWQNWESVPFNPPSTLDTMAMDPEKKAMLKQDLTSFMQRKEFYAQVGKAWKRGYLLYGPPGTGKSSLIGAMSNFTGYDVYDLELTKVHNNFELRQLLIRVKDRSIIVVEDIDCSIPIEEREWRKKSKKSTNKRRRRRPMPIGNPDDNGVTLSGLLNFTDGLWSSCGKERIFIFTTNFVKTIDEALLRPGRMDVHLKLGYCSFAAFKSLAETYLKIQEHELFPAIEALLAVKITPAAAVEALVRCRSDPHRGAGECGEDAGGQGGGRRLQRQ